MKTFFLFVLLNIVAAAAYCQDIVVKAGSEKTYQLGIDSNHKLKLTLIDSTQVTPDMDPEKDLFKQKVGDGQIKIVVWNHNSGGQMTSSLMIKTGLHSMLKYSARIKRAGRRKFVITDVEPVHGTIAAVEMWPFELDEIMLFDFDEE